MNDFHARFTHRCANAEVEIWDYHAVLFTSTDRIYISGSDFILYELHWMNNLNEKNIRNTVESMRKQYGTKLKFINNCTDNLDISTLSPLGRFIVSLEVNSNGPISVNPTVCMNSL